MGTSLIREVPYSEVTATLEALAALEIDRQHLTRLRLLDALPDTRRQLIKLLKFGSPADPVLTSEGVLLRSGRTPRKAIVRHYFRNRSEYRIVWNSDRFSRSLYRPRIRARNCITVGDIIDRYIWTEDGKEPPYGRKPMTANFLYLLLGYPELRPKEWGNHPVIFPGTKFLGSGGKFHYGVLLGREWEHGSHIDADAPLPDNHYFAVF